MITVHFAESDGMYGTVKTIYKKVVVLQIFTEKDEFQCQINFYKPTGKWKYKIKKPVLYFLTSGYFENIIIPRYIVPQLDNIVDNHLVDKILLE